jgi:hypothetical protein
MATTTGGTTYVTSTDLVANYPTASLALANRVDVVASGGPGLVKTSGYTITVADILGGNKFLYNSASPGTFTLPTSSLVDGMVVNVAQIGAGALTVSGGTIVGTTVTTAQYQGLSFVYVSSGTTWYSIAPNATAPGLALITPTSIANSGGSASASGGAVTFTGVTSISLNGVFSSTYDNYFVVMRSTVASGSTTWDLRMRLAGSDAATGYAYQRLTANGGAITGVYNASLTSGWLGYVHTSSSSLQVNLFAPALAAQTNYHSQTFDTTDGSAFMGGAHTTATAYDGVTFIPGASNASGTVRIYGYRN